MNPSKALRSLLLVVVASLACAIIGYTIRDIAMVKDSTPLTNDADTLLLRAAAIEMGGGDCSEAIEVARRSGVDYTATLSGCLKRQPAGMHTMFWLSAYGHLDAAASEEHSAIMGILLRHLGDEFFGNCLLKEPQEVREAVGDNLRYDFGWGSVNGITSELLQEWYPLTFGGNLKE